MDDLIKVMASSPPAAQSRAAIVITDRQGMEPRPPIRCGSAVPSVKAPSRIPNARPRSDGRAHEAVTFMPTGYTPARHTPVANRSGIAALRLSTVTANSSVIPAARNALAPRTNCGRTRSARLRSVEPIAPTTNPTCTDAVNQTASPEPIPHSLRRLGTTAVAENQTLKLKTWITAMSARWRTP